jgi:MoaA/NifB/PqqE/SkfB family radical SAM enzyme
LSGSATEEFAAMLQEYLSSLFLPTFDWIQVEVTSFCDAACIYCPRTVYRDRWIDRHMTLATFGHIVPVFRNAKLVYLQGWGEPFLNPHFFHMVEQAKKAGCLVGTTTNGMVLDGQMIEKVVRSGLDILSFSLAHTDPRNDYVRQGTRLEDVLNRIREVTAAKKKAGTDKPSIHVAYVLLRSNKDDLKRLPLLLRGLEVDEVIVSTLDFVPSPEWKQEEMFPQTEDEYKNLSSYLESVRVEGTQRGIPIYYSIGNAKRRRMYCSENIQKAFVVSAAGEVSPCVFTNMPVLPGQAQGEGTGPVERLIFGNINELPFGKIWGSEAYKKFRSSFEHGHRAPPCMHCPKLYLTCEMEHLVQIPFLG